VKKVKEYFKVDIFLREVKRRGGESGFQTGFNFLWGCLFQFWNSQSQVIHHYEYIDVMVRDKSSGRATRLIVDMDFRSQFEVARATAAYKELTNAIPSVFVGSEERLSKIISLLCSAAKRSLRESRLHVPPWRKATYMKAKWLSKDCKKVSASPNMDLGVVG
jgi:uncharacterized protein (TIGR01615 family)